MTDEVKNVVEVKAEAMESFIEERKINGIQMSSPNENVRLFRTNLLIEGQALPVFIVIDTTVYTLIQVVIAKVPENKNSQVLAYANELNDLFGMLKYHINKAGDLILTFSIPAVNDKFDPALVVALLDQVKAHLEATYASVMKKIWQD